MSRFTALARRHAFDTIIVLGGVQAAFDVVAGQPGAVSHRGRWLIAAVVAAVFFALLGRRRWPFAAPAAVWVIGAGLAFVDVDRVAAGTVFLAGLVAAYLLGHQRDARKAAVGLVIVIAGVEAIVVNQPGSSVATFVVTPLQFSIAWLAGWFSRAWAWQAEVAEERAERAERDRESAARIAVAEERARIARELHDIVAHAMSVMVLQVGAVRHNLPATLEADREALDSVERMGREALAEMRRLLGAMRADGQQAERAPQPGLESIDSLLADVCRAGLQAELHLHGDRFPLPRALDLSAYRIIQEGLTNALKHAHATCVDVTIRYGVDDVHVEVRDDGRGAASSDELGHGLVGVRERVKIYGGEMMAYTAKGGGFVLATRLPLGGAR